MNDIVVGTFGRLEEQKGHAVLIEAFSKLVQTSKKSNLRLAIFGEGSLRKALQHQAAAEGLLDHTIKFAGFVPNATEFLQATDVFALSSFYEGLPISLLEAMRAGKCIVATDIPGISEAVRHQEEALLVSAGDADSLCSGLEQLIHSESRRRRLGMRARATFIEHFTEDEMCRKYEEIYTDLAARSLPLHVSEPRVPRQ